MVMLNAQQAHSEDDFSGQSRPVPGRYHVAVNHAEEKASKTKATPGLEIEFQVLAGSTSGQDGKTIPLFLSYLGSDDAKMIVRLMAEACIKVNGKPDKYGRPRPLSPYRQVFDNARVAYAARTAGDGPAWAKHESHGWKVGVPPKDQPENACEHCKNAALRIVGKEILRDLWIVAGGGQP